MGIAGRLASPPAFLGASSPRDDSLAAAPTAARRPTEGLPPGLRIGAANPANEPLDETRASLVRSVLTATRVTRCEANVEIEAGTARFSVPVSALLDARALVSVKPHARFTVVGDAVRFEVRDWQAPMLELSYADGRSELLVLQYFANTSIRAPSNAG
jgi:hypothetical protein